MAIAIWIMFGLVAGLLVKPLMPGRDAAAFILSPLVGVQGAVVGGCFSTLLEFGDLATLDLRGLLLAVGGALLLLIGYRAAVGQEWRRLLFGRTSQEN